MMFGGFDDARGAERVGGDVQLRADWTGTAAPNTLASAKAATAKILGFLGLIIMAFLWRELPFI